MLPFKRVLCPTDFSEPAGKAVSAAGELASAFSAGLVLLHVVGPVSALPAVSAEGGPFEFNIAAYAQALVSGAADRLHRTALKSLPRSLRLVERVVQWPMALEIVEAAEEEGADLIVISTHDATGIRRLPLRSVAERLVRLATCPVRTIRCGAPEHTRRW